MKKEGEQDLYSNIDKFIYTTNATCPFNSMLSFYKQQMKYQLPNKKTRDCAFYHQSIQKSLIISQSLYFSHN